MSTLALESQVRRHDAAWEADGKLKLDESQKEGEEEEEENHGCNYVLIGTEHFAVAAETNT